MIRTTCRPKIHDTVVACWALSKWNLEDNLPCFKNKTVLDRYDNSTCELRFVVICTFENKIITSGSYHDTSATARNDFSRSSEIFKSSILDDWVLQSISAVSNYTFINVFKISLDLEKSFLAVALVS
jgi:hypothetical protein